MDANQNKSHKRTGNAKHIANRLRLQITNLSQSNDSNQVKQQQQPLKIPPLPPILPPILPNIQQQNQTTSTRTINYDQMIFALAKNFMVGSNNNNSHVQRGNLNNCPFVNSVNNVNNTNVFILNNNYNPNMIRLVNNNSNAHNVLYQNLQPNIRPNVFIVPVVNTNNSDNAYNGQYIGYHVGSQRPHLRYNPFRD